MIPHILLSILLNSTMPIELALHLLNNFVRHNLAMHRSVTPFVIRQPTCRPRLLERVYKPMRTLH